VQNENNKGRHHPRISFNPHVPGFHYQNDWLRVRDMGDREFEGRGRGISAKGRACMANEPAFNPASIKEINNGKFFLAALAMVLPPHRIGSPDAAQARITRSQEIWHLFNLLD